MPEAALATDLPASPPRDRALQNLQQYQQACTSHRSLLQDSISLLLHSFRIPHITRLIQLAPSFESSNMANYLASIFGTEQDKVNCSFYYKIGACRHGDRCSRKHVKPSYSQTILMPNMYQNPAFDPKNRMNSSQLQNHFDAFYEDVWCEMCKYGELEELVVCENNNDRKLPTQPLEYKCPLDRC